MKPYVYFAFLLLFGMGYAQESEKSLVVVIASHNNSKWVTKNLDSVFTQAYENYRVIYMDDASTDGTADVVEAYSNAHQLGERLTVFRGEKRRGSLYNQYHAIHSCRDDEIVLIVDGDDWLAHDRVFKKINEVYSNPSVWLTYGQYEQYPGKRKGLCRPFPPSVVKNNTFRTHRWLSSHLRTFYAGLFKKVAIEDFLYGGEFISMATDIAMMIPMLELAGERYKCISEVLYVYNRSTGTNIDRKHKKKQAFFALVTRQGKPYSRYNGGLEFLKN